MQTHILILAAGAASRMRGGDKCLEQVAGEPLLRRLARLALETGCAVTVALPPDHPKRGAALEGLGVATVTVADAGDGMAASLVAGVSSLPVGVPVLLLLADLPMIDGDDLARMLAEAAAHPQTILRGAEADGRAGHPVVFPPDLRAELLALAGDEGARWVLKRHAARVRLVTLPAGHATTDLDTPEDWAEWRLRNG